MKNMEIAGGEAKKNRSLWGGRGGNLAVTCVIITRNPGKHRPTDTEGGGKQQKRIQKGKRTTNRGVVERKEGKNRHQ